MWSMKKSSFSMHLRNVVSLLRPNADVKTIANTKCSTFGKGKIIPNRKQAKALETEYLAVLKILNRSSCKLMTNNIIARNLHTTVQLLEKQSDEGNKSDKNNVQKSSSNEKQNQTPETKKTDGKNEKDDEKKKEQNKKEQDNINRIMALFMKGLLWTAMIYSIGFALLVVSAITKGRNGASSENYTVSWKEFVQYMLASGEVKEIIVRPDSDFVQILLHDNAIINGRRARFSSYFLIVPNTERFEAKLRDVEMRMGIVDVVPIRYERQSTIMGKIIASAIAIAILYAILKRMPASVKGGMDSYFQMGKAKITIINPATGGKGVYFKDVAGLQEAKVEVMEFVDYLKRPERYQALGARVPKGALLLGPPGCGKTLLAKAVATEAQVPFLTMNGSEFIEMIGGLGAARVRDLFKQAKKKSPCIIYIDEIDAVGRQRSNTTSHSSGESEQTLNQLLVEMDGMASKKGVLMLASTNRADILDKALLRPGRFDRHILIDLPTLQERKEIFERHLSKIKLEKDPSTYSARLAIITPGFSGADIANVCNEAALHAARTCKKIVTKKDLEYAVERSVGGTEKRSHSLSDEERRIVAYHESGHALVGWLLENSDVLQKVTIVPRTNLTLGFAQYTPQDQKLFSKEHLLDKICMALGGRAAENITFSKITTGAQNDLDKVTKMAFAMVAKYGMNERIGPMYVPDEREETRNLIDEKPYSKALGNLIDEECRKLIQEAYFKAENILKTNRDKLVKLAEALLQKETLNYEEVVELIGPPKYDSAQRKIDPIEFEQSLKNLSSQAETTEPSLDNEKPDSEK